MPEVELTALITLGDTLEQAGRSCYAVEAAVDEAAVPVS